MAFSDLLSSVFPQILFKDKSPISGEIKVVQKGRERQLLVNGVRQSINYDAPGIENRYWGQVVQQLHPSGVATPDGWMRALILGLGGGTVVHLLAQKFPGIKIDTVEVDPVIVEIAKKFFDLGKISGLNIICADADDVIQNLKSYKLQATSYDLVLSDLYCGSKFPEKFAREDFICGVKSLLAPAGLAIFNRVIRQGNRAKLDDFVEKIRRIFVRVEEVEVPGPAGFSNLLICCHKEP